MGSVSPPTPACQAERSNVIGNRINCFPIDAPVGIDSSPNRKNTVQIMVRTTSRKYADELPIAGLRARAASWLTMAKAVQVLLSTTRRSRLKQD